MSTLGQRLVNWAHQVLIAINQLAQVTIKGPLYVITGGYLSADETISSAVGRASRNGLLWAKPLELFIDALLWPFEGWNHCRRSIEDQLTLDL